MVIYLHALPCSHSFRPLGAAISPLTYCSAAVLVRRNSGSTLSALPGRRPSQPLRLPLRFPPQPLSASSDLVRPLESAGSSMPFPSNAVSALLRFGSAPPQWYLRLTPLRGPSPPLPPPPCSPQGVCMVI
ncbi:hypothetical protein Salat_1192800 [Sesamum alatum]|uniref:Uncharacterized protein n=1 Tax=Sesamum alatum TaxID=300844 RepID=A0AAE2CNQ2_9LAMI|nr:hypothetical protein Salat_1192800 [Sesamum alatum]